MVYSLQGIACIVCFSFFLSFFLLSWKLVLSETIIFADWTVNVFAWSPWAQGWVDFAAGHALTHELPGLLGVWFDATEQLNPKHYHLLHNKTCTCCGVGVRSCRIVKAIRELWVRTRGETQGVGGVVVTHRADDADGTYDSLGSQMK